MESEPLLVLFEIVREELGGRLAAELFANARLTVSTLSERGVGEELLAAALWDGLVVAEPSAFIGPMRICTGVGLLSAMYDNSNRHSSGL